MRSIPVPFRAIVDEPSIWVANDGYTTVEMPNRMRQTEPIRQRKMPALLSCVSRGVGASFSFTASSGVSVARSPVSSSIVIWKHSLKALSFSNSGVDSPPSHFDIACLETPIFSASCSCESPCFRLSVYIFSDNIDVTSLPKRYRDLPWHSIDGPWNFRNQRLHDDDIKRSAVSSYLTPVPRTRADGIVGAMAPAARKEDGTLRRETCKRRSDVVK